MGALNNYIDDQLCRGQSYFTREEGLKALGLSPEAFSSAANRLKKKHRLASPWQGFFLIVRPEDRGYGTAEPACWIDPLMNFLEVDYRISLLRAAAYHGSSHQAAQVFQVIAPRQLHNFNIGRHRLQFNYQSPDAFAQINRDQWLDQIKRESGFAKVAGIELTLLDCMRYFHRAGGINYVAQIVKDLGAGANPRILANAAQYYENATVRRLGFLLDQFHHHRQSKALEPFALKAKSMKELDPSILSLPEYFNENYEKNFKWKLIINENVEPDF